MVVALLVIRARGKKASGDMRLTEPLMSGIAMVDQNRTEIRLPADATRPSIAARAEGIRLERSLHNVIGSGRLPIPNPKTDA